MSLDPRVVLVVSDDPWAVDRMAAHLRGHGCRARPLADYRLAIEVVEQLRPDVVVLDQIVSHPDADELLDRLEAMGEDAPRVVLLRYAPGPAGAFSTLRVTVVAGEGWLDDLPGAIARSLG
ncbi:MAG: hypothetical protein AB7S26_33670 [Sandaracinaceae bacterium]